MTPLQQAYEFVCHRAGPCRWPAPFISFRRLRHAPRRCRLISGPCRFPSRPAETTMRPFRPPLRPPAPTAFLDRMARTSAEIAGREKPKWSAICCHHTWRRALRLQYMARCAPSMLFALSPAAPH